MSRKTMWRLVRVAAVIGATAWLARSMDLRQLGDTLLRLSPGAFLIALGLGTVNMGIAAIRWRMLMRGFGVVQPPGIAGLARLIFVGHFYNTFVPGAVGGDVVRGVVVRRLFAQQAASYIVVLLERLIGLSALGLVLLVGLLVGPALVDWATVGPWIIGLVALGVCLFVAGLFTDRLRRLFRRVPRVERPRELLAAFAISLAGHVISLGMFWSLARGLGLPIGLSALVVVVPLGLIAAVLPIAIAGIGPREVALVALLHLLDVPRHEALSFSLAYALVLIALAAVGGLLQLWGGPLTAPDESDTTRSSAAAPPPG